MAHFILLSTGLLATWLNEQLVHPSFLDEHGLLENLQAAVLLFSMAVLLIRMLVTTSLSDKLFFTGGALLCLTCALREMDVEELNVHPWLIFLGSGPGRDVLIGSLWFALLCRLMSVRQQAWQFTLALLRTIPGQLLVLAGLLVIAGMLFDKGIIPAANSLFWEETLELGGYSLVCLVAHTVSGGASYVRGSVEAANEPKVGPTQVSGTLS